MTRLISDLLTDRTRRRGADPLLTYYDLGTAERTELSAVSFANWVDKTANLMVDELGLDPGCTVALILAEQAPGHWVTLVWELACWRVGAEVRLLPGAADLTVTGPDWAGHARREPVVACSLHPLGLGFAEPLPPGLIDYGVEVRGQPDVFLGPPPGADRPAWADRDRTLTQADLVQPDAPAARRLVRPTDPWTTVRDGLLAPLAGDGSTVVVVGDDPDRLARIAATERVTAGPPPQFPT